MKFKVKANNPYLYFLYTIWPLHRMGEKQMKVFARFMYLGDVSRSSRQVIVDEGFCSSLQIVANYVKIYRDKKLIEGDKIKLKYDSSVSYEIVEDTQKGS